MSNPLKSFDIDTSFFSFDIVFIILWRIDRYVLRPSSNHARKEVEKGKEKEKTDKAGAGAMSEMIILEPCCRDGEKEKE